MSMVRWAVLLCCLPALLAAAGGCGDEGGGEAAAEKVPLSKAAYLRKANAECRKKRANLEGEVRDFLADQPSGKSRRAVYADLAHLVLLPTVEDEMEAVRALGAPPGGPDKAQEMNYLLYQEEAALNALATTNNIFSRRAVEREFIKSGRELSKYGLYACANGIRQSKEERGGS
jgi:hypothetical protein